MPEPARCKDAGFTLFELLVALAIVALATLIAVPLVKRGSAGQEIRIAAADLVSASRTAKARAIRTAGETALNLDVAAREYWSDAEPRRRRLPAGLAIRLDVPAGERTGTGTGRVRFFADGSSSGARLALGDGRQTATIAVDWLTGAAHVTWSR